MPEQIVTDNPTELDLSSFTITLSISKAKKQTARLCFSGVPMITLNGPLANEVSKRLGERVAVQADPNNGCIALCEGEERKLIQDRTGSEVRKICVSAMADELIEVFGICRSVYFDPIYYDNAVLLKPNGRVTK